MTAATPRNLQVLAKSKPEVSLERHIDDCLHIYTQLIVCFPNLPLADPGTFWQILRDSLVFHDTGKAHVEFQRILYGKTGNSPGKWYGQRHELFSLYFIGQADLPDHRKNLLYYAVIGHHKSISDIYELTLHYYGSLPGAGCDPDGNLSFEIECGKLWKNRTWKMLDKYGFRKSHEETIDIVAVVKSIYRSPCRLSDECFLQFLLLTGFVKQCDHLASAGIRSLYKLSEASFSFLFRYPLYKHQETACSVPGSALLSSPTGSGKTETALLWLKHQFETNGEGRVFYVLPYTASINAMYERLDKEFRAGQSGEACHYVGMLHGKLMQYIENKMESGNASFSEGKEQLIRDFKTLVTPMKIVTPFQLLKHLFGLKGFEKGMAEWAGGYFIFDEIHAYDSKTFAQIVVLLEFICRYMNARVFIMTATLPAFMLNILSRAIGKHHRITADEKLYEAFDRHRIRLEEGLIQDALETIQSDIDRGKKVLVVCNTVEQAQNVYRALDAPGSKLLIHGSFNAEDRSRKEIRLQNEDIRLLVGTQAIEVSLNIDYDTIYTEPAPLDALIQRFGRVNRKREKGICLCHVFDTQHERDKFIYDEISVAATLDVLRHIEKTDDGRIHESELQKYIDLVYPHWTDKQQEAYELTYELLSKSIHNRLQPLCYDDKAEESFYKQFDGVKVLPVGSVKQYQEYLDTYRFVKAEGLLVSIRESRFYALQKDSEIYKDTYYYEDKQSGKLDRKSVLVIKRAYDEELGLQINKVDTADEHKYL